MGMAYVNSDSTCTYSTGRTDYFNFDCADTEGYYKDGPEKKGKPRGLCPTKSVKQIGLKVRPVVYNFIKPRARSNL